LLLLLLELVLELSAGEMFTTVEEFDANEDDDDAEEADDLFSPFTTSSGELGGTP
jgi:hypothetical protein